jgi:ribosomal protein L22
MSLHLPARRVAAKPGSLPLQYLVPRTQRRNAWFNWGKSKTEAPITAELSRRERENKMIERNLERTQGASIFDEEFKEAEEKKTSANVKSQRSKGSTGPQVGFSYEEKHMERALDPDPRWRVRYQKKKVMQMVRSGGKLTREQRLKLLEKDVTSTSTPLPTSTKKLVHLAHQISGKTLQDAITQMQFSKKKMATEVKLQLEMARDRAIAARGMGLGSAHGELLSAPKKIKTKEGKWLEISDPTALYVDQAWVTKGPWRGMRYQYHARSRMSAMWRPTTRTYPSSAIEAERLFV